MENQIFVLIDETGNVLQSGLSLNYLIYNFLTTNNYLPKILKYEPATENQSINFINNGFNTGFKDIQLTAIIQGFLTVNNELFTIGIYNDEKEQKDNVSQN